MNIRSVISVVAALMVVIGFGVSSAGVVSILMDDPNCVVYSLFICAFITIAVGILGYKLFKPEKFTLGIREGFGIVSFGWIAAAVFGCLPFMFISHLYWYDAFFETMSGFTTTGASVLDCKLMLTTGETLKKGIADLPKGLLYWRSMTHWFGGMGIVVLSLAILPFLGIGGQQLYNAEVPGPTSDQLTPKIASSAKILWGVYVLLSVVEALLLWAGGMPLFDSWCHTCGTMATGGFSTQQASIGAYDSVYIDMVITLFMFLAGCNFILHYRALRGKPLIFFKDEEFKFYLYLTLAATALVTIKIYGTTIVDTAGREIHGTLGQSMRYAVFQVVSILTTTGFCTADFDLWATACAFVLVCLMFVGGCGGSTGGGMKNSRVLLLLKYSLERCKRWMFPHSISNIRLNNERLDAETLHKTMSFFFLFIALFVIFSFALTMLEDIDFTTAVSASIANLGNIGPGLGRVGATCCYSWMTGASKIILTFAMLLGRLELYTVLVIFLPTFWKK